MTQYGVAAFVKGAAINCGLRLVLSHLWASLRARREAIISGVASLAKGTPFPARRALLLAASRFADTHTLFVTPH
jgi:hypothetical protein